MSSVFSRIIAGEEPAHFVWADEVVVAFLSVAPLSAGHTLVVPRAEIDQWTDVRAELLTHCVTVAQRVGQALKEVFQSPRAGLIIAGYEVPHLHVHVFASWSMEQFDWSRVQHPSDDELRAVAAQLRPRLHAP